MSYRYAKFESISIKYRIDSNLAYRTGLSTTWDPTFSVTHRSSILDLHFLSHYSYIKAIMLYKGKTRQDTGTLWNTLAGILWHTLAYSSILWHTLAYTDILWHSLAYSCILWH